MAKSLALSSYMCLCTNIVMADEITNVGDMVVGDVSSIGLG